MTLHGVEGRCMTWHCIDDCMMWRCMVWYGVVWRGMTLHCIAWHWMALCCFAQHCIACHTGYPKKTLFKDFCRRCLWLKSSSPSLLKIQSFNPKVHCTWWWRPHIAACKLCWSLLRPGEVVLDHFFFKMYFLHISRSRKKNFVKFLRVLPP